MKIIVNGETVETAATTLAGVLAELGKTDAKVATSLNEVFVPKTLRDTQNIAEGDRIEIVAPRQGG